MQLERYQIDSAKWLLERPRAVLGSEVGTGKSAVVIEAGNQLKGQVWLISPTSFVLGWLAQINLWAWGNLDKKVQVIKNRKDPVDKDAKWVIWTYDFISHYRGEWLPEAIAFDESHYLKNLEALRTKACLGKEAITRLIPHVWLVTGTPFPNNLIDCYPPFNFCLKGALGKYSEFAERYCYTKPHAFARGKTFVYGCRRKLLPEFVERVKPVLRRDEFATCGATLPEFREIVVPVDTPAARAYLNENQAIQDQINEAIEEGKKPDVEAPAVATFMRELSGFRVVPARDFIKDLLEAEEQVVVFVHHRELARKLTEELQVKYRVACIRGDTATAQRAEHIADFQSGKLQCLVLSLKAASTGITLTASHIAVYVEQGWTPEVLEQSRGRILRKGQTKVCLYYFLQFEDSIDQAIHKTARAKKKNVDLFWDHFHGRAPIEEEPEIIWD